MSLAVNKKAYYDYEILEKLEAGLVLSGPEVKSAKHGQINLKGSYVNVKSSREAFLVNAHIAPYQPAVIAQRDYRPDQDRKLLLNKKELKRLLGRSSEAGIAVVPVCAYVKNGYVKLEIAVCRGKKKYDKRDAIKKRDFARRKRQLLA